MLVQYIDEQEASAFSDPKLVMILPVPPIRVMSPDDAGATIQGMSISPLVSLSDHLADSVAAIAPSVVQVHGRRRPLSGIAYDADVVITSARALGREDGARIAVDDGRTADAQLVGWDPASGLAVLRTSGLSLAPAVASPVEARVGQLAIPVARSWSNAVTASAGIVAVIGGPLRTGRGQSLDRVLRITAPIHDGFAGGPVVDASGRVLGVSTSAFIRGFAVVIPAALAWTHVAHVLEHGKPRAGFLGISGQAVRLPEGQRDKDRDASEDRGLLVFALTADGPAAAAGVLVGDVIIALDGRPIATTDDLFALLTADRVGRAVPLRILRGGSVRELRVTIGERA
jgi:S1-C subfamily serine protease